MMIMWNMTTTLWRHFFFPLAGILVVSLSDPCATSMGFTWSKREGNTPVEALKPSWAWKPVQDSRSSLNLLKSGFNAVFVAEDSCPTCPAELGKGSLAFIRVLATNHFLCLFIWRWGGEVPKSTCVKEAWIFSLHSWKGRFLPGGSLWFTHLHIKVTGTQPWLPSLSWPSWLLWPTLVSMVSPIVSYSSLAIGLQRNNQLTYL